MCFSYLEDGYQKLIKCRFICSMKCFSDEVFQNPAIVMF